MKIQKRIIENHVEKPDALFEAIKSLKPDQELVTSSVPEAIRIRTYAIAWSRQGIRIKTAVRGSNLVVTLAPAK
jgi:hypothetical protein